MSSIKVIYFPGRGRAEATRLALAYYGVDFEDVRLPPGELFGKYKSVAPYGQFPVLEVDGKFLGQSGSQLRYVAKNFGGGKLVPVDAFDVAVAGSLIDQAADVSTAVYAVVYGPGDEAAKAAGRAELVGTKLPKLLGGVVALLGDKPFFFGAEPSVGDIAVFAMFEATLKYGFDVAAAFPTLAAHAERMRALPQLAAYFARRDEVEAKEAEAEAAAKAAAGSA